MAKHIQPESNQYAGPVFEGLMTLADTFEAQAYFSAAEELRTIAMRGPEKLPVGFYWEHVFKETGEVCNSGFFLNDRGWTDVESVARGEEPVPNMPGFVQRILPLYR